MIEQKSHALTCDPGYVDNGQGRCIYKIDPIETKKMEEITISCQTNPNQLRCSEISPLTGKPYKEIETKYSDENYKASYASCIINGGNSVSCSSSAEKYAKCMKTYSTNYCNCKYTLKGIYLNTEVPFIGATGNPRCLVLNQAAEAPINVLRALTKILMTFVMIGGFGMIVRAGVEIAAGEVDSGKKKIIGVVIAFALLGSLGVILRLINPNFFS